MLDEEGVIQLELAVTKAASNIMRHAYHGRTEQRMQVMTEAFADRICLRFWHHGTACDPAMVQPPVFDGSRDGGLGRLAACFPDFLATLDMPGYGIHNEYRLFQQEITNGHQQEKPDNWLASGKPEEIERLDEACLIPVYGRIEHALDHDGQYNPLWMDWKILISVPHDLPIAGYGGQTVSYLRLYSAREPRLHLICTFSMRVIISKRSNRRLLQKRSPRCCISLTQGGWPGTPARPGVLSRRLRSGCRS
jgi:glucan phosphorylase